MGIRSQFWRPFRLLVPNSIARCLISSLSGVAITSCNDVVDDFAVQGEAALEATSAESREDLPVYTGDPAAMCRGVKFIGKSRLVQEGSRTCDVPSDNRDLTSLTPANIRFGVTIAGIVGTMLPSPPQCAFSGEQNCVAAGDFHGAAPCPVSGTSGCYLPHYAFFTQPLMALDYDKIDTRNLRASASIAGKSGGLDDCTFEGSTGCVVTGAFRAIDTTKITGDMIVTGVTIAGVAGSATAESHSNCSSDGATGCITTSTFKAADMAAALASNILVNKTIAGVVGSMTAESHSNCSVSGAQGCVASGSFFAGTACLANSSACYLPTYAPGTQPLRAVDYDAIDSSQMRMALTISGKAGSLADCETDGALGCVTVTGYPSAKLANFTAASVQSGTTIAGVLGSLANCSADGGMSCVANGSFTAAATTGLASKVLSTATVAGVAGNVTLPDVGNVFAGSQYGVSGTGSTGTLTIPTAANVRTGNGVYGVGGNGSTPTLADCSTDGTLGCVTVTGFPSARLANFTASNVQSGTTIAGVSGTIASCTSDGQTGCVSSALLPAANISGFSPWNLRIGTTLAGVSGALKTNCRNTVNSTYFNYDGAVSSLSYNGTTGGTTADYWDTIEDYYGFPSTRVAAWSADTLCDNTTWTDVTTTNGGTSFTTCGTSSTCIYQNRISNLRVTGILASGGNTTNTTTPATYAWNAAVQTCNSSTYGGYAAGSWRLPTQKELMSLYEHGIVSLVGASFITLAKMQNQYFWSSSTFSNITTFAWYVNLAYGYTSNYSKTSSNYVVCVR